MQENKNSENIKPMQIDVVIISYAKNSETLALTHQTLQSLMNSEDAGQIQFNVTVIESEKSISPYNYPHTQTYYPDEKFGYHKYLNIGARKGKAPFLCLANNDLIFGKAWASAILQAMQSDPELKSCGTWCKRFHPTKNISKTPNIQYGYTNGIHVSGWCIFLTRDIYEQMGGLDENFVYWYCDDDYRMTLKHMEIKHALITHSEVEHITSHTTLQLSPEEHRKMTLYPNLYFDFKWNHRSYPVYLVKKLILWIRIQLNRTR